MWTQAIMSIAMLAWLTVVTAWGQAMSSEAYVTRITAISGHLAVLSTYAGNFARNNPGFAGTPSDPALGLPSWFQRNTGESVYVTGGRAYVSLAAASLADGLAIARAAGGRDVGVNQGGWLTEPGAGPTATAVPAAVANGAIVVVR